MPLVNISATNLILARQRSVVIDYLGTDPKHVMCVEDGLDHNVSPSFLDSPTVCDPAGQVVGPTQETVVLRLQKTTGVDGSINRLLAYRGTTTTISWLDEGHIAVGPTNPEYTGLIRIPRFSLSSGSANNPQYFELECPVVGQINVNLTTTPIYAGHHGVL
ncbi:MAG: hypothetical protein ACRCW4_13410 [Candidatus Neomicrothrix subdominans]